MRQSGGSWLATLLAATRNALFGDRDKLAALLHAVPEGVLEIDATGRIIFANPQLCALFGYQHAELLGRPVETLVPPAARSGHAERRARFWDSDRSRPMGSGLDISGIRKDGSLFPVDISLSRLETSRGTMMYVLVRDDSVRRAFETKLLESNRRLTESVVTLERNALELQTLTEMGELLHGSNSEGELLGIVADTMQRLFPGWSGALYMLTDDRPIAGIVRAWGEQSNLLRPAFQAEDCWAMRRGRPHHDLSSDSPRRCAHRDGAMRCSACVPLLGQGKLLGVLHLAEDFASQRQASHATPPAPLLQALANQIALSFANLRLREELRAQSTIDPLTGLHNRRVIDGQFEVMIRRAQWDRSDLSLLVIDIDHFKSFNDRFGHDCGDLALRRVAGALQRTLRHDDIVCRMGGEEFSVLLPGTSAAEAIRVADKLRIAVEHLELQHNGRSLGRLSISIGVATLGASGDTVAALLRHADRALYRAKAAGRNCVMACGTNDESGVQPRLVLAARPAQGAP